MLRVLIIAAGIGQLLLAAGSLAIPRVLKWREELAKLRPLTRQVFWTYAGYIWTTNVCFGLVSLLIPDELLSGSKLASAVCGFITLYWFARIVIQFAYFDRRDAPAGMVFRLAEVGLVGLFVFLSGVYGWAVAANVKLLESRL
jgi:hypothetical protein